MKFTNNSKNQMILIYITCSDRLEAEKIGKYLLNKRLTACVNIFPEAIQPFFFWPPKSEKIDDSKENVLIVKSTLDKYDKIEEEVIKIHSYDTPCILAIPVIAVADKYWNWLESEAK
jgi:periplasmic divalent cation tolerance protein